MVSERLEIVLDEPSRAYFSGQMLKGRVRLTTDKPIQIKSLKLVVRGKGLAHWNEGKRVYQSTVKIIKHECPLNLPGGANISLSLNAGTHEYPFEFVVGPNLPTSIETLFSYIRYWLKAVINYGGLTRDEKIKIGFSVNKLTDINTLDNIFQERYEDEWEKTLCCSSNQIRMKGWVDRTAYVPGETITFNGSAEILGGGKFRKSSLKFYQIYTLHCEDSKHDIIFELFQQKREGPIDFDQWNRILMTIPPVPPTTQNGFIDVHYCISLKADPGFWHRNVVLEIPIVIGNIPALKSFVNFQQPAADAYSDPMSLLVAKADDDYDSPVYRIPVPNFFGEGFCPKKMRNVRKNHKFLKHFWPQYACYKLVDSAVLQM